MRNRGGLSAAPVCLTQAGGRFIAASLWSTQPKKKAKHKNAKKSFNSSSYAFVFRLSAEAEAAADRGHGSPNARALSQTVRWRLLPWLTGAHQSVL